MFLIAGGRELVFQPQLVQPHGVEQVMVAPTPNMRSSWAGFKLREHARALVSQQHFDISKAGKRRLRPKLTRLQWKVSPIDDRR
jgi:hypothetical protein